MTAIPLRKAYTSKRAPLFGRDAKVVIVGGGPSGLHFASKMIKAGYKAPVVLEATDRAGGKSHTKVYDEYPTIPHEMGTCFLSRGYAGVRKLLEEYGLGDQEVEFGEAFVEGGKDDGVERIQRMVWDLKNENDLRRDRRGGLGQSFDDWVLAAAGGDSKDEDPKKLEAAFESEMKVAEEDPGEIQRAVGFLAESKVEDSAEVSRGFLGGLRAKFFSGKQDFEDKNADGHKDPTRLQFALGSLRIARAAGKYIRLHEELFGKYAYGLPPRPETPEAQASIDCTFGEWLRANDLGVLEPIFTYSQSAQGYGAVPWVPALYGLWWNSPEYLQLTFTLKGRLTAKTPELSVLKCGFSALWQNMIDKDGIDVRCNCPVKQVTRSADGVTVKYGTSGGGEETIDADHVVMAVAYRPILEQGILSDPTPAEDAMIKQLTGVTLKTTLISVKAPPPDLSFPGQVWLAPLNDFNGRLRAIRHCGLALLGRELETRPRIIAYQALRDPPTAATNDTLRTTLVEDLKVASVEDAKVLYEKTWDYFWHFPQSAITAGQPWQILEMQGDNRTVWVGASASFESVLDVAAYNDLLFEMCAME